MYICCVFALVFDKECDVSVRQISFTTKAQESMQSNNKNILVAPCEQSAKTILSSLITTNKTAENEDGDKYRCMFIWIHTLDLV